MYMKQRTLQMIIINLFLVFCGILFLVGGLYVKEFYIVGLSTIVSGLIFIIGFTILHFFVEKLDIRIANVLFDVTKILCLLAIIRLFLQIINCLSD